MTRLKADRRILKIIGANIIEETGDAGLLAEWISACKLETRKTKPPTPVAGKPPVKDAADGDEENSH